MFHHALDFSSRLMAGLVLFAASFAASSAWAEDAEGPKSQPIHAVERGLYVETNPGLSYMVGDLKGRSYSLSPDISIGLGYDIHPVFNLSVGVTALTLGQQMGKDRSQPLQDLLYLAPMLKASFALITTERNALWVRGEAGFALSSPEAFVEHGPIFGLNLGFERYTYLRHFSLGIQAGVRVITQPDLAFLVHLSPVLKYTF